MTKNRDVWVVVPNWNGADVITECLNSLSAQDQKHKIVIVDNGSEDGSALLIEKKFPFAILLKQKVNLGFAGGVNVGIRYALDHGAKAVALFNNDAIADKKWLEGLVEGLEKIPEAGIVTGKFMRLDKKHIDSVGECYSIWGVPFPRGRNQLDEAQYDNQELVFSATGGASLYRADLFNDIGLFDERFFAYFEDVDIGFRAQLAGWQVVYEPRAVAYHHVGATASKLGNFARYHSIKNFFICYTKNMPAGLYFKYLPLFTLQSFRWLITSALKGHLLTYLKAFGRFILYLPAVLRDRRTIQGRRKVSPSDIDQLLYHKRPPKIPSI